ncbi:MAG: hypothetical protein ACE5G8_17415, partial [Anaerolineae bacterium]
GAIRLLAAVPQTPLGEHRPQNLILYWQAKVPLVADYTVFIHLRTAGGVVVAQADGPPVEQHFPTTAWQPGDVVQDIHPLPDGDLSDIDHAAVGLYNPATGERLPAFGPDGRRLDGDAVMLPFW